MMTTFNAVEKTWITEADPSLDILPMGSYLGEEILRALKKSNSNRVVEYNHDIEEAITAKDIYERTKTIALNLQDFNLGKDDIIALYCRHNSYISSLAFGCYLNGTAWCPFDIVQDNLEYLLDYIRPTIFIYDEEFKADVKHSLGRINFEIKKVLVFGNPTAENSVENMLLKSRDIKNFTPKDLSLIDSPDNLIACISFTSGSTGKPKAVPISHSMFVNAINALFSLEECKEENTNILSPSGIRWIAQLVIMFLTIFSEAKKTFTGRNPDPRNICDAIHKWKVTLIITANSMVHTTLEYYKNKPGYDFSCLRTILSGGEAPCASMNAKFKKILPNVRILQAYGMTECGGIIALQHDLSHLNGGHLLKGFSLKVVDESGENVGHGTPGIICMKGRSPLPGYFKREDSSYDDNWFKTGDYGFMTKDNHLHVYCRFKDVIKCKGKWIVPSLIEQHFNAHYLVNFCLMISVPGSDPDDQRIAIFVKLEVGVSEEKARKELIPYLKLVIDLDIVVKFQIVDFFKTNSTGKADREILKRELLLAN